MRELKRRKRFASEITDDKLVTSIEALEEQLADELETDDMEVPSDVTDETVPDVVTDEADEIEGCDETEANEIMAEADELLASFEACGDTVVSDEDEIIAECKEVQSKIASLEAKKASEIADGIEDEIGDEANGGVPSVSELRKETVDCDTYKEVFPTNSKYVANITKRLDRVANILEKRGMKRLAFRVDQLSDKLESSIR